MSIEDDIAAVRAGRGTPDQQMTAVRVLDALLKPSGNIPKGIQPDPMAGRSDAFYEPLGCDIQCSCPKGWCAKSSGTLEKIPEPPKRATYTEDGYNNWGSRYHARCICGNDMPTNMYGMGTCPSCKTRRNPLTD